MCLQMFWGRGWGGGIFSGLLKSQRVMGSREAKIIGYMHMYKRNHMEAQASKRYCPLHVVSRKQTVHIVKEGIKELPAQDLLI